MSPSIPVTSPLTSYLTIAKWAAIALLVCGLLAAIGVMIVKVNTWHRDSQALPAITAARDQAVQERNAANKAKADEQVKFVGKFDQLGTKIATLTDRLGELQVQIDRDRADRAIAYNHFMETTANVPNDAALGSDGDLLVRRGLLDLLRNPDTGLLTRGAGGGRSRGDGAGVPGTAAGAHDVPGQPAGADHQSRETVVPAAGVGGRQGAKRAAQRRHSRRADVGTGRAGRKTAARRRVRQTVSDKIEVIVRGEECQRDRVIAIFEQIVFGLGQVVKARVEFHG